MTELFWFIFGFSLGAFVLGTAIGYLAIRLLIEILRPLTRFGEPREDEK